MIVFGILGLLYKLSGNGRSNAGHRPVGCVASVGGHTIDIAIYDFFQTDITEAHPPCSCSVRMFSSATRQ